MKKFILPILLIITLSAFGQRKEQEAQELLVEAIEVMENGNPAKAIRMLERCKVLDPNQSFTYDYEIAFAHTIAKNYSAAIKLLKRLAKDPNTTDQVFQMLGNNYDYSGRSKKAIKTYEKGLAIFPNSGCLHLERGVMDLLSRDFEEALVWFEKGIDADPGHSSNYFWASKLYLSGKKNMWGMLYGEIFILLESTTKRTEEISKLLYRNLENNIEFESDTVHVNFIAGDFTITVSGGLPPEDLLALEALLFMGNTYGSKVYEPLMINSLMDESEVSLASMDRMRKRFLAQYYKQGHAEEYPNALFDYQMKVMKAGHFESYNYWLYQEGASFEFGNWLEANEDKYEDFEYWMENNPIELDRDNMFHRTQYSGIEIEE